MASVNPLHSTAAGHACGSLGCWRVDYDASGRHAELGRKATSKFAFHPWRQLALPARRFPSLSALNALMQTLGAKSPLGKT